jgi:hypothetical protein
VEFGSIPAKFATKMRVKTTKRLLADNEKPLEKIAAECRFGSVDTMQRAFRQETGTDSLFQRPKMSLLYRLSRNHSLKMEQNLQRKCCKTPVVP